MRRLQNRAFRLFRHNVKSNVQKTVLSTADVARLFKVTETTVKRWADEGNLKCQKTPGGHRKYEMRYVVEFARDNKFDPLGVLALLDDANFSNAVQVAVLTRDFQALVAAFVERALSPDKTDLHALLSYLYEHKIHLWEIYDHVLRPGMADIGERWARGEIGINHEHRASHETLEALSKLQAQILIKPLAGKTVLCACVGDEKHEIGLRCVANIFDSEGWRVHYLGAETPHDAIVASIRELRPSVVCLSITRPGPALDAALQAIVDAARDAGACVIAGGSAASRAGQSRELLDGIMHSSREVLDFIGEPHLRHARA